MIVIWRTSSISLDDDRHKRNRMEYNGERSTDDGNRVYYSGLAEKHEHCVEFIFHSTVTNSVMGCQTVSSRIITIRLKATAANTNVFLTLAQGCGLVIFRFDFPIFFLDGSYILVTIIRLQECPENNQMNNNNYKLKNLHSIFILFFSRCVLTTIKYK